MEEGNEVGLVLGLGGVGNSYGVLGMMPAKLQAAGVCD
jgi:hypothetical protein